MERKFTLPSQSRRDQYTMKEVVKGNAEAEKADILRAWRLNCASRGTHWGDGFQVFSLKLCTPSREYKSTNCERERRQDE